MAQAPRIWNKFASAVEETDSTNDSHEIKKNHQSKLLKLLQKVKQFFDRFTKPVEIYTFPSGFQFANKLPDINEKKHLVFFLHGAVYVGQAFQQIRVSHR